MKKLMVGALLAISMISAQAKEVTILYSNDFPWTVTGEQGIDILLLKEVDKRLSDVEFKFQEVPWKRCLDLMGDNKADSCFTASFKTKRQELGVYPGGENAVEANQDLRVHSASYTLYVRKDSKITNNGMDVKGATGFIGGNKGYSIVEDLGAKGNKMDQKAKSTKENFEKLVKGELDAVVALTLDAEFVLKSNADIAAAVKTAGEPLVNKPYYIMFSKKFFNEDNALAEKIWAEAAKVRDTQAHKDAAAKWLATQ